MEWALRDVERRLKARENVGERVFAGADFNRLTQDWFATILSANQEIQGDIRRLRGASRSHVRDTAHGKRYINLCVENVIGHAGIQLQLRTPDRELNQRVEGAFRAWGAEQAWASADGRLTWCESEQAVMRAIPQDGFALVRHIRGIDNPFGYSVQLLDADCLDHEYGGSSPVILSSGNEIRLGVETEPRFGRVVAYWLWTRHPSEAGPGSQARVRVPASDLELLYIPMRTGQSLGEPWFANVLFLSKMAAGMEEAAITAGRVGASSMGAIETDPDKAVGLDRRGSNPQIQEFDPGRFMRLNPGEKVTALPQEYPSTAYGPFMQWMRMSEAIGLNVAYSSLTGDLSGVNFSSIRAGLITERDSWRAIQHWLIAHLHRRVFREWAMSAALYGQISASDARAAIAAQTWKPRGWKWVDPQSEVTANAAAVDQLFTTRSEICAEQGLDFEDVVARSVEEEQLIREAGLTVPGVSLGSPTATPDAAAQQVARETELQAIRTELHQRTGDLREDLHAIAIAHKPAQVIVPPASPEMTMLVETVSRAIEKMSEPAPAAPAPQVTTHVHMHQIPKANGLRLVRDHTTGDMTAVLTNGAD